MRTRIEFPTMTAALLQALAVCIAYDKETIEMCTITGREIPTLETTRFMSVLMDLGLDTSEGIATLAAYETELKGN